MFFIKSIYCRVFQFFFKEALPILPYRQPNVLDSFQELPPVLKKHKCSRVLLITDPGVYNLKLTAPLEQVLRDHDIFYTLYSRTCANPTSNNIEEARGVYLENNCDCLIGFGGGSSMDCAKAVGARLAKPNQTLAQMEGILKIHHRIPLLIEVPTTAGTGSETTLAAVVVDSTTRHKYAINDFPLIPKYAVLTPVVTVSLPKMITATTGMDALTHAVEAYIGNSTTRDTEEAALEAVNLIFHNLSTAVNDGGNLTARRNMLRASYLAGCAFTKSYVGYVHAVAHSLGGEYNIPHGLANAVLLPFVLEAYGHVIDKKLHRLAIAAGIAKEATPDQLAAKRFIRAIKDMKKDFGIGDTFPELKEEDIPKLAKYADHEGNPLYPVPVLMNARELEKFYYMVLEK